MQSQAPNGSPDLSSSCEDIKLIWFTRPSYRSERLNENV